MTNPSHPIEQFVLVTNHTDGYSRGALFTTRNGLRLIRDVLTWAELDVTELALAATIVAAIEAQIGKAPTP